MKPKVLAIIPARGGSKGLPRKNVLPVSGKPLIAWTIEAAKRASCISRLVLSSDDQEIIETAKGYGCEVPFVRPAALATDTASTMDVVLHALSEVQGCEFVMLLQPTSPLRSAQDIDAAFQLMTDRGADTCVSVCPVDESPYWMYRCGDSKRLEPVLPANEFATRRQDLPPIFILNGAIYISRISSLMANKRFIGPDTVGYVMSRERSIDIDTAEDFSSFGRIVADATGKQAC